MKKLLTLTIIIALLSFAGCSSDSEPKTVSKTEAKEITVYITKTGECYHNSDCTSLRKSKIERKLSEVYNKYRDCSICTPPTIKE
jgi:uncharacterized protein YcfL